MIIIPNFCLMWAALLCSKLNFKSAFLQISPLLQPHRTALICAQNENQTAFSQCLAQLLLHGNASSLKQQSDFAGCAHCSRKHILSCLCGVYLHQERFWIKNKPIMSPMLEAILWVVFFFLHKCHRKFKKQW